MEGIIYDFRIIWVDTNFQLIIAQYFLWIKIACLRSCIFSLALSCISLKYSQATEKANKKLCIFSLILKYWSFSFYCLFAFKTSFLYKNYSKIFCLLIFYISSLNFGACHIYSSLLIFDQERFSFKS